jgi:hypothetical protein
MVLKPKPSKSVWTLRYRSTTENLSTTYEVNCIDPASLKKSILSTAKPSTAEVVQRTVSLFDGKANSFRTSCGFLPGYAQLLLRYADVIDIQSKCDLVNFVSLHLDDGAGQLFIGGLTLLTYTTITHIPSSTNYLTPSDDTPVLATFVDRRWDCNYSPFSNLTGVNTTTDSDPYESLKPAHYLHHATKNRTTYNENGFYTLNQYEAPYFQQTYFDPANPHAFTDTYLQQQFDFLRYDSNPNTGSYFLAQLQPYPAWPKEFVNEQTLLYGRQAYEILVALCNQYGFVLAPDYLNRYGVRPIVYTTKAAKEYYSGYDTFDDVKHLILEQHLDLSGYVLPRYIKVLYPSTWWTDAYSDIPHVETIDTLSFPTPSNYRTWSRGNYVDKSVVVLYSNLHKHKYDPDQDLRKEAETRATIWLDNESARNSSLITFGGFQRLPLNKNWQAITFYDIGTGPKTLYHGSIPSNFHQNTSINDLTCFSDLQHNIQLSHPHPATPAPYSRTHERYQLEPWKPRDHHWKRGGGVCVGTVSTLSGESQLVPNQRCWFRPWEFLVAGSARTLSDTIQSDRQTSKEIAYWLHSEYVFGTNSGSNQTSRAIAYWSDTAKVWIVFDLLSNWEGSEEDPPVTDPPIDPEADPPNPTPDPDTDTDPDPDLPTGNPPINDGGTVPPPSTPDYPRSYSGPPTPSDGGDGGGPISGRTGENEEVEEVTPPPPPGP